MLTDVVPQNPLIGKSLSTVLTHKGLWKERSEKMSDFHLKKTNQKRSWARKGRQSVPLTDWLGLPVQVVKQLRVAGEHAAAGGTRRQLLLSVAAHVLSQTVPDLEVGVAA